jgi:hypothetical protein
MTLSALRGLSTVHKRSASQHLSSVRGICLLIAWTNEIVQAGHGWLPHGEEAARMTARSDEGPPAVM